MNSSARGKKPDPQPLSLLAINLTRRCNLNCAHCYLDAQTLRHGGETELTTEEICQLLDEIAALDQGSMIVLTGGEPLVRKDLEEIVRHGAQQNLAMVIGTNAVLLSERRILSLQTAGALGVGISIDSLDAQKHDKFRGQPGGWAKTMAAIDSCRKHAFGFQIHFSVHAANAHELEDMAAFSAACGARVLNIFFLICTGRGDTVTDLTPVQYEQTLQAIIELQEQYNELIIRPRCAPYFKRIAHQRRPDSPLNRISGSEGDGCIAGISYCRVTPEGGVTACPYIENEVGNIRRQTFSDIWQSSPDFARLRQPELQGKCGQCEYQKLCGGCRARPVAAGDDLMDSDTYCSYLPQGGQTIEPLGDNNSIINWTPEATQRLQRVPRFLRKMVRKRTEAYVMELGEADITADHMQALAARRFGSSGPPGKP